VNKDLVEKQKPKKIVVIGAGLSGLTTAFRLSENKQDVEVYEARSRVGGRILTVNVNGHLAELGGENISNGGQASHTVGLIHDLHLQTQATKSIFNIYYCENGQLSSFTQLLKENPFSSDLKNRLEEIAGKCKNMHEVLLALFPDRGLAYKVSRATLASYEGAPVEHLSVFYIETLYHLLLGGLSAAHQNTQKQGPVYIDRMVISGGNSVLPETLAAQLQGRVHLNHALVEVGKDSQGTYVLRFENGRKVTADILVFSIPCPVFKDITVSDAVIPVEKKRDIESICYGTPSKILVPVSGESAIEKQYTDGGVLFTFFNRSRHVANMYYTGGHGQFTEETIQEIFKRDFPLMQKIYTTESDLQPVLSNDQSFFCYAGPVGHSWPNDPFAQGAYSCVGAGQEELFTSIIEVKGQRVKSLFAPIDESLFFAGEHTSILLDLGGTIEAAVESGERIARLIENYR